MIALRTDPTPGYVLRAYVGTHRYTDVSRTCHNIVRLLYSACVMAYFVNRRFVMGYGRVTIGKPYAVNSA